MLIDTAPGMPYHLQECSHPWSTLQQYLPPTHSLYYSLWERTTFRQSSFTTDPFPLTQRESYMEQQHSPLERIVRLPSVLPLHALFSLAVMIHTETFDWVIFHAFSYQKKKKKRERSDNLGKFSEVPPPSLTRFLIMQLPFFVARWHEVVMNHPSCPSFTTFTYSWKWHSRTQMPLKVLSLQQNIHTIFSKPQNPLCCRPSYWDSSQGWL